VIHPTATGGKTIAAAARRPKRITFLDTRVSLAVCDEFSMRLA
jgi:hypothetical protein